MTRRRRRDEPTHFQELMGGIADGALMLLVFFVVVFVVSRAVQTFDPIIQNYVAQYERKSKWGLGF